MYLHQVFIKPKEGVTGSQLETLCNNVHLLREIPGVLFAIAVPNSSSERTNGFTYGLIVVLDNKGSFEQYKQHPNHTQFAEEFVHPIRGDSQVFGWEI